MIKADIKERMVLMHYSDNWEEFNIDGFAGWAKPRTLYTFDKI